MQADKGKQDATGQSADDEGSKWRSVLEKLGAHEDPSVNGSSSQKHSLSGGSSKSSSGSSEKRARAAVVSEIANALQFGKVEEQDIEKMSSDLRSEVCSVCSTCHVNLCFVMFSYLHRYEFQIH